MRYSSIAQLEEVHAIGEVWANILHNVYAAFVKAKGFSKTARTNPDGNEGNVIFLRLFMDQLALQPCNPTRTFQISFIDQLALKLLSIVVTARDAWIQADQNRYRGEHKCLLWTTFASRGLGVKAENFKDDSSVPEGC